MLTLLLCAQLAGGALAADSVYSTSALRALIARAAEANRHPPPQFRSYRSHIETELSLLVRDTLGREHTAQVEQFATTAMWERNGRYDLHVVGYRSQSVGVPYSALSIVRAWTVPSLYGDRLSFGAYFNESNRRRALVTVHPFAEDRDDFYRFSGGDTVTVLRIGERRIPIARIHVRPSFKSQTRLGAFEGEIDLDAERAQIVRMRGQFVTIGGSSSRIESLARTAIGAVAVAYAEFVNAEVDGQYWLPASQRTEFQAGFQAFGQTRPVFRLVSNIDRVTVEQGAAVVDSDSAASPRVVISWSSGDSMSHYGDWERTIGTQSGSVHSDDFLDLAPDVWRPTGPPRFTIFPTNTNHIVRFSRVEGVFTGIAPSVDFRSVAPGLSAGVHGGWAWTEQTARGGAFANYARGHSIFGARAERSLASTNDFAMPLGDAPGFFALLGSIDNFDYVDRRTAMLSITRILGSVDAGLATIQFGAGDDASERARLAHGLISRTAFLPNRGVAPGSYAIGSVDLELRPNVTGDFVQPGVGLRAHYEAASGDIAWQRAELGLSARRYFGPVSLAAHADGGLVIGDAPPPQKLFELGGMETFPGYRFKEFVGDRAALFRTFASYRFNIWQRPIPAWRNFKLPGLSPGLAVSANGGWSELSSAGARASASALGLVNGQPISQPTGGMRATVGGGLTFFSDILHVGAARPVDRPAPWRFVVGFGRAF